MVEGRVRAALIVLACPTWMAVAACTLDQQVGFELPDAITSDDLERDDAGEESGGDPYDRLDVETLACEAPAPVTCDLLDDDPLRAIGLNCPGQAPVNGGFSGYSEAMIVVDGLGTSGVYEPQEGSRFVVLSTGVAEQILLTPEEIMAQDKEEMGSCPVPANCPSGSNPGFDYAILPDPIDVRPVNRVGPNAKGGRGLPITCETHPELVGTGDCSNTLWAQWSAASPKGASDYAELRFDTQVPSGATGLSFDFAFGSIEYPNWWGSPFNDMFVAWLESEQWTGNVSFDELGNPISLNASFLDYKDGVPPGETCADDCEAPELAGFALEGHAATRWLTSTAGVKPGEHIELVFAVFDLSDGFMDSYVMLDGFSWTCAGNPPVTRPVP